MEKWWLTCVSDVFVFAMRRRGVRGHWTYDRIHRPSGTRKRRRPAPMIELKLAIGDALAVELHVLVNRQVGALVAYV